MATRRTTESPQGDASPKKRAPRKRATRSEQVDAPVTDAGAEVAGEARVAAPGAEAERATEAGTAAHTGGASGVSWEVRHAMIAEAAYLRAERRGFAPGGELDDWVAAEKEIDTLLRADANAPQ